jgi:uncharacterized protein YjbI with pentapeptide repeats
MDSVDLDRADLSGAKLPEADLRDAKLKRVNFSGADLRGVNLAGAVLRLTRLDGADLAGARGLTQNQLDRACGDQKTALPDGLTVKPCR